MPPGRYAPVGRPSSRCCPAGKVVVPGHAVPGRVGGVHRRLCRPHDPASAGVSLADAIDMAGRPRELLGLPAWELVQDVGLPLMLFDWEPGGEVIVRELLS